jgi:hypothetical protein
MQILLKQAEIEAALRQYIGHQGINLSGKVITVDFTAGRGATGLSAEMHINDKAEEPVQVEPEPVAVKPTQAKVTRAIKALNLADAPKASDEVAPKLAPWDKEPVAAQVEAEPEPEQEAAPATKTTSLFG